jgi:hypothetical protein
VVVWRGAWEALTGRRLFAGDCEAATLWNVMEQDVPELRGCAPGIAETVARPIMACLRRDPNQRPRDLRELAEPLARAAHEAGATTIHDLAALMLRLFRAERAHDDEQLQIRTQGPLQESAPQARAETKAEPTVVRAEPAAQPRGRERWIALAGIVLAAAAIFVVLERAMGDRGAAAASASAPDGSNVAAMSGSNVATTSSSTPPPSTRASASGSAPPSSSGATSSGMLPPSTRVTASTSAPPSSSGATSTGTPLPSTKTRATASRSALPLNSGATTGSSTPRPSRGAATAAPARQRASAPGMQERPRTGQPAPPGDPTAAEPSSPQAERDKPLLGNPYQ